MKVRPLCSPASTQIHEILHLEPQISSTFNQIRFYLNLANKTNPSRSDCRPSRTAQRRLKWRTLGDDLDLAIDFDATAFARQDGFATFRMAAKRTALEKLESGLMGGSSACAQAAAEEN